MITSELKQNWKEHFSTAPMQLKKMSNVNGLISAFNSNIDAVIKISGKRIEEIIHHYNLNMDSLLNSGSSSIRSIEDSLRGLIKCFINGIAEEWLIEDKKVFDWLNLNIGYDKLQMGGQGGIVANTMATCGVNNVFVHTASSPSEQSKLFLDLPNLLNVNSEGNLVKAFEVDRFEDVPLIHWIIEFDIYDSLNLGEKTYTCPKSNRFIATYDPLNFRLEIDENFNKKMSEAETKFDYIILSGYQMLKENLTNGEKGASRIQISLDAVNKWKANNPECIMHFEIASTQDKYIRKYLIDNLAPKTDSIGINERELIDILNVIGEEALADRCDKETNSGNLFEGLLKVFNYVGAPRIQLHMFGLYITLQKKGFKVTPIQNRQGMQLAAIVAATKAGTGSVNNYENLLWSLEKEVSDIGLNELSILSEKVSLMFDKNELLSTGIYSNEELEIIAVPTIIIDKPITLVGMGDTISSISIVAAR